MKVWSPRRFLYSLYEAKLLRELVGQRLPAHVGVILDGNRRWARALGAAPVHGHRQGAENVTEFLNWADEAGIGIVTLWMLSTDNLGRESEELTDLLGIIGDTVEAIATCGRWRVSLVGALELLPAAVAQRLQAAARLTEGRDGMVVNIAVSYGGRQEIADAVRSYLLTRSEEGADLVSAAKQLTVEDIAAHLYTKGQPDPDLVIRTSGEQRLSGFLLWQSVYSEYYFCEVYWPDFRRVDFLRALRDFGLRERRRGR